MVRQRGVTLIELMIGIALLAILAVAIFPLGRAWVANAQITKTEKELLEAYARAKNEALRNPNAVKEGAKAASLEVTSTTVVVKDSNNATIWSFNITPTVTIQLSTLPASATCDSATQKVELNNNASLQTNTCTQYLIQASGGQDEAGYF
ncbi:MULTISPECIES: pilus assembly FimT family protein [Acinetobacter]|jgi:prepilin-type N-terminal cleavage/methylation domain-containing protein|uniref:pilus assembly FimT family protein n=1 Tax=Acinetobacter TaxID=469 RepID=UPI000FD88F5F|nr:MULTISPECIES: prepilin-type N-terminal cleavage/methylation domain-containing protein [Acinetobacter]MCO8108831.1 prepilin-type N-terminal cleavage/methylation domain-containing protein [Acinetobacter indicus]MDM1331549.1 prepilin-type N-terminal cleavage/methylation domain-containing protein [Acinetobacter indicus]MDM1339817.1 prepilin-type N-terminal cleavage/methylation domain-containing protein [Acinetobacter indicus]MDM1493270.1 prepilin-type N-terminal cleavage/methylation domain-conta